MNNNKIVCVKDIINNNINIPKPILKWIGGKTQIINKIMNEFPIEITNYHEIFLGGGSVLFALLSYIKNNIIKLQGQIYAYDINEPLIYVYKNIQSKHNKLYKKLKELVNEFNKCNDVNDSKKINRNPLNLIDAMETKENYYYWIRKTYNELSNNKKISTIGSAMFIFLNKTCFRGLHRVGPNGFNVPYGHYKNPEIINKNHLDEIHKLIKNVKFECIGFNQSLKNIKTNDFIYLDPPYAPETINSFVKYNENGFNIDDHNRLFKIINKLTIKNKKILLSNADVKLVRDNFTDKKYSISSILCKRTINSKKPNSHSKEVIIKNY